DGDELCRRVVELLGDPSRRAAIGAAARDCVLRAYSWSAHLRTLDWLLDAQGTDAGLAQAVQAREGAAPNAPALVRTP
ncbi:MAG TPA: sugar transferase, partial [Thauera aminoaromatica]|nr:sugar transferase [Thauera aminoaromatica]